MNETEARRFRQAIQLLRATLERLDTLNDQEKVRSHGAVVAELTLSAITIRKFLEGEPT